MTSLLLPKHVNDAMMTRSKVVFGNRHFLCLILRQVSMPISYYVFVPLKISPNFITSFSMLSGIAASLAMAAGHFVAGGLLMILWGLLDCCDGEVARYTARQSKLGAGIEVINSNLQYVLWLPALAYGLFREGNIGFSWVLFALLFCAVFTVIRSLLNSYPADLLGEPTGGCSSFLACQFKDMEPLRQTRPLASATYNVWRNILTQQGIFELAVIAVALAAPEHLPLLVVFFVSAYAVYVGLSLAVLLIAGIAL